MKATSRWKQLLYSFNHSGNRHLTITDVHGRRVFDGTTREFCKLQTPIKACPVKSYDWGNGIDSLDTVEVVVY